MLVSVIIPVHKTILFFKSCIESVLNQTYDNLEIIIACNGGLEIKACEEFLNINDSRVVYIKTKDGRHNARNEALNTAKGDWIQFLDYDDYLFPNKIEVQLTSLLKKNNSELCICKWKKFTQNIDEHYTFLFQKLFDKNQICADELVQKLGESRGFIATSSWLVKSNIVHGLKWIDSPNDDAVFFSEMLKKQPHFIMVPEILAGYRIHNDNTSSLRTKQEFDKLFVSWKVIARNLSVFKNKGKYHYLYTAFLNLITYSKQINRHKFFVVLFYTIFYAYKAEIGISMLYDLKKKVFK